MADNLHPTNQNSSDEIDLGQLLDLVKKGFHNLGNFFLRIFIYFKRNVLKLAGLILLGIGISFGLSKVVSKKLKTDVIVRPNFESKNYLYDVVEELKANLKSQNEVFFNGLDVVVEDLEGFKINVAPIEDEEVESDDSILNEIRYLEILENFKDETFVIDILRSELTEKSVIDHKIIFNYKDPIAGPIVVKKLMKYISTNTYFSELKAVHDENAALRINKNTQLIDQIDQLVNNYSVALLADKQKSGTGVVYMEKENTLNVPSLLSLKNILLKEIEEKRLEIEQNKSVLGILNFGNTQEVKKTFLDQTYFIIPAQLLAGFFLLSLFKYLDRKSKEIE
jgi:hypothetical protein